MNPLPNHDTYMQMMLKIQLIGCGLNLYAIGKNKEKRGGGYVLSRKTKGEKENWGRKGRGGKPRLLCKLFITSNIIDYSVCVK